MSNNHCDHDCKLVSWQAFDAHHSALRKHVAHLMRAVYVTNTKDLVYLMVSSIASRITNWETLGAQTVLPTFTMIIIIPNIIVQRFLSLQD